MTDFARLHFGERPTVAREYMAPAKRYLYDNCILSNLYVWGKIKEHAAKGVRA